MFGEEQEKDSIVMDRKAVKRCQVMEDERPLLTSMMGFSSCLVLCTGSIGTARDINLRDNMARSMEMVDIVNEQGNNPAHTSSTREKEGRVYEAVPEGDLA